MTDALDAILSAGGFDIAVGNPPYVSVAKTRNCYTVKGLSTGECPDIYGWVIERTESLLKKNGRTGMIVPLSLGFSTDFDAVRRLLYARYPTNWFSSFGRIPAALFNFDVRVRNTIHMGCKSGNKPSTFTSRLHRWFEIGRPHLFPTLQYAEFHPPLWNGRVPKFNTQALATGFENCLSVGKRALESAISSRSNL